MCAYLFSFACCVFFLSVGKTALQNDLFHTEMVFRIDELFLGADAADELLKVVDICRGANKQWNRHVQIPVGWFACVCVCVCMFVFALGGEKSSKHKGQ